MVPLGAWRRTRAPGWQPSPSQTPGRGAGKATYWSSSANYSFGTLIGLCSGPGLVVWLPHGGRGEAGHGLRSASLMGCAGNARALRSPFLNAPVAQPIRRQSWFDPLRGGSLARSTFCWKPSLRCHRSRGEGVFLPSGHRVVCPSPGGQGNQQAQGIRLRGIRGARPGRSGHQPIQQSAIQRQAAGGERGQGPWGGRPRTATFRSPPRLH